jgi:hypothetical protein
MWKTGCTAEESNIGTKLAASRPALLTYAAVACRIYGYAITGFHQGHVGSALDHFTGYLVTESHRLPDPEICDSAIVIVVKVRSADAAGA